MISLENYKTEELEALRDAISKELNARTNELFQLRVKVFFEAYKALVMDFPYAAAAGLYTCDECGDEIYVDVLDLLGGMSVNSFEY